MLRKITVTFTATIRVESTEDSPDDYNDALTDERGELTYATVCGDSYTSTEEFLRHQLQRDLQAIHVSDDSAISYMWGDT